MSRKKIDWYFDYISPFAFLQWPHIRRMPLGVEVCYKPVLFAGLLKHWGHLGPAEIPQKRIFTYRHVQWLAQREGRELRFPPAHPFNPLKALRLTLCCQSHPEAIDAIFNYLWVQGRSLEDEAGFRELCTTLGVADPDKALREPQVKAALKQNGQDAVAEGVFGVPTAVVEDVLFWGADATDMLLDFLNHPQQFREGELGRVSQLPIGISRV